MGRGQGQGSYEAGAASSLEAARKGRRPGVCRDEWSRWQQGQCGTYAYALALAHPGLLIGVLGLSNDEGGWEPTHYFAHDGEFAYDSAGRHPLPYHGVDGTHDMSVLDQTAEDWGLPDEDIGPQPDLDIAAAQAHAARNGILDRA